MVNGINSNNPINSYSNTAVRSPKADMDAPAFLLQYDEKGVVWDRNEEGSDKESETRESSKNGGSSQKSLSGEKNNYKKQTEAENKKSEQPLEFGEFFGSILSRIKSFFASVLNFVWYGDENETLEKQSDTKEPPIIKAADSLQKDDAAGTYTAVDTDAEAVIKDMIARHDMDGVVDVLTKNHTIQPAHNSTLLTYYNRHGKIVDLSHTNTGRILHGDRHMKTM